MPPPTLPQAGGTAFDATDGGVWISNGMLLAKAAADSCKVLVPAFAPPLATPSSVVTGLALNQSNGTLFISENYPPAITTLKRPIPLFGARCFSGAVPAQLQIGGLATSDLPTATCWATTTWWRGWRCRTW